MSRPARGQLTAWVAMDCRYDFESGELRDHVDVDLQSPPDYYERARSMPDLSTAVAWGERHASAVVVRIGGHDFWTGDRQFERGMPRWPPRDEELERVIEDLHERERALYGPPAPPGTTITWRATVHGYPDFDDVRSSMRAVRAHLVERDDIDDVRLRIDNGKVTLHCLIDAAVSRRAGWEEHAARAAGLALGAALAAGGDPKPGTFPRVEPADD